MKIQTFKRGGALHVKIKGRLDAFSLSEFEEKFNTWIESGENFLVADLGELDYICSGGMRSFLSAAQKLKFHQGKIYFCNLKGTVKEVFSLSGFGLKFPIYESLEEALNLNHFSDTTRPEDD